MIVNHTYSVEQEFINGFKFRGIYTGNTEDIEAYVNSVFGSADGIQIKSISPIHVMVGFAELRDKLLEERRKLQARILEIDSNLKVGKVN